MLTINSMQLMIHAYEKLRQRSPNRRAEVTEAVLKSFHFYDSRDLGSVNMEGFGNFLTLIGVRLPAVCLCCMCTRIVYIV